LQWDEFREPKVFGEKQIGKLQAANDGLTESPTTSRVDCRRVGLASAEGSRDLPNERISRMKQNYESGGSTTLHGTQQRDTGRSTTPGAPKDKAEMMKRAEEAGRPGPGHKALEAFLGNWKAEVKCWMEPGGAPNVSQATAKASWVMNGRFLEEDFQGEMMGKPFRGRTIIGFDNVKQMFTSVWYSDMQTSLFTSEGRGDNNNKVITLEGTSSCPATGRTDVPTKIVLRTTSPDKRTLEMFDESQGNNSKTMEITYTRS